MLLLVLKSEEDGSGFLRISLRCFCSSYSLAHFLFIRISLLDSDEEFGGVLVVFGGGGGAFFFFKDKEEESLGSTSEEEDC